MCTYRRQSIHISTPSYACMYTRIHVQYTCIHLYMYVYTDKQTYIQTYIHRVVRLSVRPPAPIYTHMYVRACIHTYMLAYI